MIDITQCTSFEWDTGNQDKNWRKHNVTMEECQEAFFNQPVTLFDDLVHSGTERRYGLLGETDSGRALTLFFTIRSNRIRVISARNQSKKERAIYQHDKAQLARRKEAA